MTYKESKKMFFGPFFGSINLFKAGVMGGCPLTVTQPECGIAGTFCIYQPDGVYCIRG